MWVGKIISAISFSFMHLTTQKYTRVFIRLQSESDLLLEKYKLVVGRVSTMLSPWCDFF